MDKRALKVLKTGQEYAERGADPETQTFDPAVLRKAEARLLTLTLSPAPALT